MRLNGLAGGSSHGSNEAFVTGFLSLLLWIIGGPLVVFFGASFLSKTNKNWGCDGATCAKLVDISWCFAGKQLR